MITIKRKEDLVIAKTYYTPRFSKSMGILLCIVGVIPSLISYYDPSSVANEVPVFVIYILSSVFILAGLFFIYPVLFNSTRPRNPLKYDPKKLGFKMIYGNILGAIFTGTFLSIFIFSGFTKQSEIAKYIILLFIVVFGLMFSWRILKGVVLVFKGMKYGVSHLNCVDLYRSGDTIIATLTNKKHQELDKLEVNLRNLTEHPAFNSKQKDVSTNGFVTEIHTKNKLANVFLNQSFEIEIPIEGKKTDYIINNPTYWELSFKSTDGMYFSRFFINVS